MSKGKRGRKRRADRRKSAGRGNGGAPGTIGSDWRGRMWTILAGAVLVLFVVLILALLENVKEELRLP
ncbi:MAG: hypothetical protein LBE84_11455 [Planctomycetota bacterium]|jgi:hypothetical protein|nr:hypothetical protein [Planctomycetota bacterium]